MLWCGKSGRLTWCVLSLSFGPTKVSYSINASMYTTIQYSYNTRTMRTEPAFEHRPGSDCTGPDQGNQNIQTGPDRIGLDRQANKPDRTGPTFIVSDRNGLGQSILELVRCHDRFAVRSGAYSHKVLSSSPAAPYLPV